jgi:translation initiation factor 2B subunit (eIF-2B alpha/beta/delta family)
MEHQLERRLGAFERNRRSGAAELAREAVAILQAARARSANAATLNRLRRRLARAHPTMAAVWNAAHAAEPREFLKAIAVAWRRAARNARRLLPSSGTVVTLSYSSTVVAALQRRRGQVIVAESLPGGEGERMARALRRRGTRAIVVPDATVAAWVTEADAVVFGADAVTRRGVINKVGSRLLALAARAERCPCYVVADTSKFALPGSRFPLPDLGPGDVFEYVALALVTRVITERRD